MLGDYVYNTHNKQAEQVQEIGSGLVMLDHNDLYEYDEKISWDRNSVRQETLFDERELMDGIEDNSDGEVIAVECPKCGASYCAAKEYASKCPYCGEENGKKGEA